MSSSAGQHGDDAALVVGIGSDLFGNENARQALSLEDAVFGVLYTLSKEKDSSSDHVARAFCHPQLRPRSLAERPRFCCMYCTVINN